MDRSDIDERISKDLYINGEWIDGEGQEFNSIRPYDGLTVGRFNSATEEQVKQAIEAAEESFEEWKELSMVDRAEYLWSINKELKDNIEGFGAIVSQECGKEISEGEADVREAQHMVEFAASLSRHPTGEVIPSEIKDKDSYMRRKPKGVIGSITPWNFPIAIPFWHIAIPLVYGNCVVFKPSELTPVCGRIVTKLIDDSGIPDGVFNMVQGEGDPVGEEIVNNSKTNCIQFTGSAEVGWNIQEKVSCDFNKSAACEMGGKNALIITEEADLEKAVKCAILASFKTTGQRCVSTERLIVHSEIYDDFKSKFVEIAKNINVGEPLHKDTFMGPLINKDQVDKFNKYKDIARQEDANVLLDKNIDEHKERVVGPFIFEMGWDSTKKSLTEEVFGPYVALIEYSGNIERALEIHNDVDYGLAGSIISEDYRQINTYRDKAEVGLAYANLPCIGAEVHLPFGGVKKSGNGFPSGREVIEICTHRTAWTVNNSDNIKLSQGLSDSIDFE